MGKFLFSADELRGLTISYPDLMRQCIRNKQLTAAIHFCEEMQKSQIALHDFFSGSCTVLWSWIGEHLGETAVEAMFRYVFDQSARRQFFDAASAEVPPHLAVIMLATSWRAHSCFEAGEHPGKFTVSEDEEKFTFTLNPCGSGGRLVRARVYEKMSGIGKIKERIENELIEKVCRYFKLPEGPLEFMFPVFVNHFTQRKPFGQKRVGPPHEWTFDQPGIPAFCCQCGMVHEKFCKSGLVITPPDKTDDKCVWRISKQFLAGC